MTGDNIYDQCIFSDTKILYENFHLTLKISNFHTKYGLNHFGGYLNKDLGDNYMENGHSNYSQQ